MSENSELLEKRASVYGDYRANLSFRMNFINSIKQKYQTENGKALPDIYEQFFIDIGSKLMRLATTPNHLDSWRDMAGYSTLILQSLQKTGEGKGE